MTIDMLAPAIRDLLHLREILREVQGGSAMRLAVFRQLAPKLTFRIPFEIGVDPARWIEALDAPAPGIQ